MEYEKTVPVNDLFESHGVHTFRYMGAEQCAPEMLSEIRKSAALLARNAYAPPDMSAKLLRAKEILKEIHSRHPEWQVRRIVK